MNEIELYEKVVGCQSCIEDLGFKIEVGTGSFELLKEGGPVPVLVKSFTNVNNMWEFLDGIYWERGNRQ